MEVLAKAFDLPAAAASAKFLLVEESGVGREFPLSGEKLALVLTVYRAADFAEAVQTVRRILDFQGRGHSMGLHTTRLDRAHALAEELPVVRVLVNFAHTFGNGGGFDSGLEFTLTMGCGSWQKNIRTFELSTLSQHHPSGRTDRGRQAGRRRTRPHWARYGR